MHELGITRNVVAICAERANGAQVLRVTLEIGKRAGVMAESVTTTTTAIPTIDCSAIAAVCAWSAGLAA